MGRRKIQIAPITDDRNRNVTFGKRRNGLFKKAYELGVLCSVDVAVLVWGHNGKLFAFSSQGNLKGVFDRYSMQSQDEMDVIGPRHYGGEINPSTAMNAGLDLNASKGSKGGNKRRRRSDDDSDEDDDGDGDSDGYEDVVPRLGSGSRQASLLQATAASATKESSTDHSGPTNPMYAQRFQQQQEQQMQQSHSAHASHPFFGNYPYPGYSQHVPNTNPALGNSPGFYAPSAAAVAAAAAATSQYSYGGLPPHLLRAAAQQYAQENGPSNGTPASANHQASGYAPIVNSPTMMEVNQQQQQQQQQRAESSNSYDGRQNPNNQSASGSSPRSARKPALHLTFSNNSSAHPSASRNPSGPSRNSSMHENDGIGHSQQQFPQDSIRQGNLNGSQQSISDEAAVAAQESAAVSAYAEQAGLTVPPIGMQFPDSFLTSPSQLFPEIYRSMNAFAESQAHRAMTFGAENTPGIEEEDAGNDQGGRNIFRWPTLGNIGSNGAQGNLNRSINGASQALERNDGTHPNHDTTSHLRINGQANDIAMVKRENDAETETISIARNA